MWYECYVISFWVPLQGPHDEDYQVAPLFLVQDSSYDNGTV